MGANKVFTMKFLLPTLAVTALLVLVLYPETETVELEDGSVIQGQTYQVQTKSPKQVIINTKEGLKRIPAGEVSEKTRKTGGGAFP